MNLKTSIKLNKKIKAKEALIKRDYDEIEFSGNPTKVRF